MTPRLHADLDLTEGAALALPGSVARHVQVLRLQPGDALTLFNGRGGEWAAHIVQIGRREVQVQVGAHAGVERELPLGVFLAVGMPANERMDTLVEKATELGVTALQPLLTARSVMRLAGERAERKVAHWQAVAISGCEQCGRNRVPRVAPIVTFSAWLDALSAPQTGLEQRLLLSLGSGTTPPGLPAAGGSAVLLSGPEGGLEPAEEAAARARGFTAVTLGQRVLRADTAPLAMLAWLALQSVA